MFGYHDVVLKIKRETGWNERESAAYAERDMQAAGEDEEFIIYVMTGIIATITHSLAQVLAKYHYLVSILLDLDLKGIGDGWDYFQLNTEAIWLEYMPHYTRSEYDAGRKHWAAGFLNRSQIFYTDDYRHLEEQARVNLTRLAAN